MKWRRKATAMRAWEKLDPETRDKVFFGQQLYQFSALDRWDDAANLVLKQVAVMKEAGQEPGADLHAYAAATLRMAGREKEAAQHDGWVDKLSLGNAETAFRIGGGYAYGRDYQRAAEWWRRAVIQAGNQSEDFANALKFHTDQLLETRQWHETAALSELLALQYVGSDYLYASHLPLMRFRLQSDTARALAGFDQKRESSLALLEQCHRKFANDGSLADFFFPALREVGLLKQHDAWFRDSWKQFEVVIRRFPDADNVRNTAAWFASRAMRELDAAERHVRKALELNPRQSAYLDTMAEIQFAKGQREKALEWSNLAINYLPEDIMLRRQHERFRSASLPK
jgi:tetratricopeptide (TPR) repeat protein